MQQPRHPGIQVVIPDNNGANGGQQSMRPLSVDEALQYTPMTSAPVFGLGMTSLPDIPSHFISYPSLTYILPDSILRPDIGEPSLANLGSTHDRQVAGKIIDALDNETQDHGQVSDKLDTTRQHMQHLLDGNSLTQL